jgi:hypothetical protein
MNLYLSGQMNLTYSLHIPVHRSYVSLDCNLTLIIQDIYYKTYIIRNLMFYFLMIYFLCGTTNIMLDKLTIYNYTQVLWTRSLGRKEYCKNIQLDDITINIFSTTYRKKLKKHYLFHFFWGQKDTFLKLLKQKKASSRTCLHMLHTIICYWGIYNI